MDDLIQREATMDTSINADTAIVTGPTTAGTHSAKRFAPKVDREHTS